MIKFERKSLPFPKGPQTLQELANYGLSWDTEYDVQALADMFGVMLGILHDRGILFTAEISQILGYEVEAVEE